MGNANRYTLSILEKGKEPIIFEKSTLEYLDSITTYFKNEKELIDGLSEALGKGVDLETTKIMITYNHCKEQKKVQILYEKDKMVLNKEDVMIYILQNVYNKKFVFDFVNRYIRSSYLGRYRKEIVSQIKKGEDYQDCLNQLLGIIFKNYKATRDAYLFTKKYEKESVKSPELRSSNEEKARALKMLKENFYYQFTLDNWMEQISNKSKSKVKQ